MPKFEEARDSLVRVTASLLTMIQANMVTSYLTLFEDLVVLLNDCLLLLRMTLASTKPAGSMQVLTANTNLSFFTSTVVAINAEAARHQGGREEEKASTAAKDPQSTKEVLTPPRLSIPSLHNLLLILTSTSGALIHMLATTSHFLASSPSFLTLISSLCEQLELSTHNGFQGHSSSIPEPLLTELQELAVDTLSTMLARMSTPPDHIKLRVVCTIMRYTRQQIKSMSPCKVISASTVMYPSWLASAIKVKLVLCVFVMSQLDCLIQVLKVMLQMISKSAQESVRSLLMMAAPEIMETLHVCTTKDPDGPEPAVHDGPWSQPHLSVVRHMLSWVLRRTIRECPQSIRHFKNMSPDRLEWDLADWVFSSELMLCWHEIICHRRDVATETILAWASGQSTTAADESQLREKRRRKRPRDAMSQSLPPQKRRKGENPTFEDFIFGNGVNEAAAGRDDRSDTELTVGEENTSAGDGNVDEAVETSRLLLEKSHEALREAMMGLLDRCQAAHGELKMLLADQSTFGEEMMRERVVKATFKVVHGMQLAAFTAMGRTTSGDDTASADQWMPLFSKLLSLADVLGLFPLEHSEIFINTAIPHLLLNLALVLALLCPLSQGNADVETNIHPEIKMKLQGISEILCRMSRSCLKCMGRSSHINLALTEMQNKLGDGYDSLTAACFEVCPDEVTNPVRCLAEAQRMRLLDKIFFVAAGMGTFGGGGGGGGLLDIGDLRGDDGVRNCIDASMDGSSAQVVRDSLTKVPMVEAFLSVVLCKSADALVKKAAMKAWPILMETVRYDVPNAAIGELLVASLSAGNWHLRRDAKEMQCHAYLATWLQSLIRIAIACWTGKRASLRVIPRVRTKPVTMIPLRAYCRKQHDDGVVAQALWNDSTLMLFLGLAIGCRPLLAHRRTIETRVITMDAMFTLLCATPLPILHEQKEPVSSLVLQLQHLLQDDVQDVREEMAGRMSAFLWDDAKLLATVTLQDHVIERVHGLVSYLDKCLEERHKQENDAMAEVMKTLKLGTVIRALGTIGSQISSKQFSELYIWAVIKLVELWTAKATYSSVAFEELARISKKGYLPMESMLTENPRETMPKIIRNLLTHGMVEDFVDYIMPEMSNHFDFLHLAGGYVLTQMVIENDMDGIQKFLHKTVRLEDSQVDHSKRLTEYSSKVVPRVMMENYRALECWFSVLGENVTLGMVVAQSEKSMCAEILWEMALAQPGDDEFIKAKDTLKVLANVAANARSGAYDGDWYEATGTQLDGVSPNRSDMVGTFVADHFLFTVSNYVMPVDWRQKPPERKLASMRCLQIMMETVRPQSLALFAPKVVVLLNQWLTEGIPIVQELCCRVMSAFVHRLPDECLVEHLTILAVAMLRVIENPQAAEGDRAMLVSVLEYLILDKHAVLKNSLKLVPFLPNIPELEIVNKKLNLQEPNSNFQRQLKRLIPLLNHDSSSVRLATLRKVLSLLRTSRPALYGLISGSDTAEDVISDLVTMLLRMCPDETEKDVRIACCICLGEIGAVDPARLNVTLCSRLGKGEKALVPPTSPPLVAPWAVTESELGMTIIESMLVPLLRAAAQDHDRIPYAIQQLLGLLYLRGPIGFRLDVEDDYRMDTQPDDDVIPEPRERPHMPDWLRDILVERQVLSAVEPLWNSYYVVKKQIPPREPPFFRARVPFDRCLNNFCRYFIVKSRGPFRLLFSAVQGIIRISGSLLLFIFPYLVADAWCCGDEGDKALLLKEIKWVIGRSGAEKVEEGSVFTDGDHMATQAVFSLLDTIRDWSQAQAKPISGSSQNSQLDGNGRPPTPVYPGVWEPRRDLLRTFLEALPSLTLVQASMRIHAYTRALKYLELAVQRPTLASTEVSSSPSSAEVGLPLGVSPSSSSPLQMIAFPFLEAYEVELYQKIFSHLDEPDSMAGLAAARRWAGLPTTLRQRIREYEHAEEWAYALQGYEQSLQEGNASLTVTMEEEDKELEEFPHNEREVGLLRSLIELDHLQSAINQYLGMISQKPSLANDLSPLGIEACWRLQQWPLLKDLLKSQDRSIHRDHPVESGVSNPSLDGLEKRYPVLLAQAIQAMHQRDKKAFERSLASAREEVMLAVSAASMESYQRCYTPLIRLHVLNELEQGYSLLNQTASGPAPEQAASRALLEQWQWESRLNVMTTSIRLRAPVMAVRRTIFQMAQLHGLTAQSWVTQAVNAIPSGRFQLADAALRHAATLGMDSNALAIHEAELLHAQGNTQKALLLLEPVDTDLQVLRNRLADIIRNASPSESEEYRFTTAERLLLTTSWMIEARLKYGQAVLDRFQLALELRPKWEEGHFALGKYFDFLAEARKKELVGGGSTGSSGASSSAGSRDEGAYKKLLEDDLLHSHIANTVEQYAMSLQYGAKHIFQSMPRLLTLWFEVGTMVDSAANLQKASGSGRGGSSRGNNSSPSFPSLSTLFSRCNAAVKKATQQVPAFMWYTSLPQLLSRVGHCKGDLQSSVVEAVVKVLSSHPEQAMWSVTGLCFSKDTERKRMGERIMHVAKHTLNQSHTSDAAEMLTDSRKLFADLINVATSAEEPSSTSDRRIRVSIGNRLHLTRFLVPIQAALVVSLPNASKGPGGEVSTGQGASSSTKGFFDSSHAPGYDYYDAFPNSQMQIQKFDEFAHVLYSKAKPKKVSITTTCGRTLVFLCKEERQGDQRKDARVMEFNGVINRLLQRDPEGRRRKLRLRTYAVVCLNEECGLMEWVPNTQCFRQCVQESLKPRQSKKGPSFRELRSSLETMQSTYAHDIPAMAREFRDVILTMVPPTLRQWFFDRYPEPTSWFEARTTFTRAAAVWSAVGHVIGLGDRHGENILVDTGTGEVIHVDFDCIFDKGLTLNRPEVVPFRLTPNMVDAMGVTGHEGIFRCVMELTLRVLRDHRETLLSVLEPFLSDPTVSWEHLTRLNPQLSSSDAHAVLAMIDERLRGIYNLRVPASKQHSSKRKKEPVVSNNSAEVMSLPLSVEGQVQKLIHEATSLNNLCVMYVGWQPYQ